MKKAKVQKAMPKEAKDALMEIAVKFGNKGMQKRVAKIQERYTDHVVSGGVTEE